MSEGEQKESFLTRHKYFKSLVKWAFSVCDADKTGTIERDELYTGVLLVHLRMAKYVGAAATFPASKETVDKLFDTSDIDKSGTIDEEEFSKIMVVCCGQVASRIVIYLALLLFIVPCLAKGSVLVLAYFLIGQTWFENLAHFFQAPIAAIPWLDALFDWDTLAEDIMGTGIFIGLFPVVFNAIDSFYQEAAEGDMLKSLDSISKKKAS